MSVVDEVTAANERQVGAVVDGIEEALRGLDAKPVRREGDPTCWTCWSCAPSAASRE